MIISIRCLLADRTAYTKHVVNRLKKLEGKDKPNGVINAEATEGWKETGGVPLPAQMFRLGSEVALENTTEFTYNLISTWYINDSHNPKSDFEKTAMEEVNKTGEPYKGYQEIAWTNLLLCSLSRQSSRRSLCYLSQHSPSSPRTLS